MVRHVILWQLKEDLPDVDKVKTDIQSGLEQLLGVVPGLQKIAVYINGLPTSNADIMLDCTLQDAEALARYAEHPEHVKVRDNLIAPFVKARVCIDFEVIH